MKSTVTSRLLVDPSELKKYSYVREVRYCTCRKNGERWSSKTKLDLRNIKVLIGWAYSTKYEDVHFYDLFYLRDYDYPFSTTVYDGDMVDPHRGDHPSEAITIDEMLIRLEVQP